MASDAAERATELAASLGAGPTGLIGVDSIVFRTEFRKLCEANRCGHYGNGWMCPPAVGEIEDLIGGVRRRSTALVISSINRLTGNFDWNGMMDASAAFSRMVIEISAAAGRALAGSDPLVLGAGPCRVCPECAYGTGEPCRHPDKAVMSLEANGVDVSQLAKLTGLKYNNGPGTVTFFGAIFFNP